MKLSVRKAREFVQVKLYALFIYIYYIYMHIRYNVIMCNVYCIAKIKLNCKGDHKMKSKTNEMK